MRVSGTIVYGISPRPGSTWDGRSAAPDRRADPKRNETNGPSDDDPPPEPGTGTIVDRKV